MWWMAIAAGAASIGCASGRSYDNPFTALPPGDACLAIVLSPLMVGYYVFRDVFEFVSGPLPWDAEPEPTW